MAQLCGFFNSRVDDQGNYDREYFAEDFAAYFASFIGNGIFPKPSKALLPVPATGMKIKVQEGKAWINGWWYYNTEELELTLSPASGTLKRIDAIVVRWSSSERNMWLAVKEGIPALTPQKPTPQRDADIWELIVGYVTVNQNIIQINQAHIQDTRLDSYLCGLVHGLIDQLDTTDLGNQLQGFIDSFIVQSTNDYEEFQHYLNQFEQNINNLFVEFEENYDQKTEDMQDMYNYYIAQLELKEQQYQQEWENWIADKEAELNEYPAGEWMDKVEKLIADQPTEKIITFEYSSFIYPHSYLWNIVNGVVNPLETWGFSDGTLQTLPVRILLEPENRLTVFVIPEYTADDWQVEQYKESFYLLRSNSLKKALLLNLQKGGNN